MDKKHWEENDVKFKMKHSLPNTMPTISKTMVKNTPRTNGTVSAACNKEEKSLNTLN